MAQTKRTCPKGHEYYKSTDCPTCPKCEEERGLMSVFHTLGAPVRRALEREGIHTIEQLSNWSEKELLKLHGIGPSSIPKIRIICASLSK